MNKLGIFLFLAFSCWAQYTPPSGAGGTVTAVSVASANGISGTSSGGATPALTIALGNITPSSVTTTGSITSGSGSGVGGAFDLAQGTLPAIAANTASLVAPTSITGYEVVMPGAACSGLMNLSNSSNVVTASCLAAPTVAFAGGWGYGTAGSNPSIVIGDDSAAGGNVGIWTHTASATKGTSVFNFLVPTALPGNLYLQATAGTLHLQASGSDEVLISNAAITVLSPITYNINTPAANTVVCYKTGGILGWASNTAGVIGTTCN